MGVILELKSGNETTAAESDGSDLAGRTRFEALRGTGRNVETEPGSCFPIEGKSRIRIRQMQVRADLHRPITGVEDHQPQTFVSTAVGVQFDGAGSDTDSTRAFT
jgi:hypothetical protein